LWFSDPATYDQIEATDRLSFTDIAGLAPDKPVQGRITKADGSTIDFTATHTMNDEHIEWFKAGGALNLIRAAQAAKG
jgi:aconitate hydratase